MTGDDHPDDGAPSSARSSAGGVQHPGAAVTPPESVTIGGDPAHGDPGPNVARITHGDGSTVDLVLPGWGTQGPPGDKGPAGIPTPPDVMARINAHRDAALMGYLTGAPGPGSGDEMPGWVPWVVVWCVALLGLSLAAAVWMS